MAAVNSALPIVEARHNAALAGETNNDVHVTAAELAAARQAVLTAAEAPAAIEAAILRAAEVRAREIGVAHQEAARAAGRGMYQATVDAAVARAALAKATESFHANHAAAARYRGLRAAFGEVVLDGSSPSLTRHDGIFQVPTPDEFKTRVAGVSGWWHGVDEFKDIDNG